MTVRDKRTPPVPKREVSGFGESLDLLLNREQYCYRDIGQMFGVSGERVRQWETSLLPTVRGWAVAVRRVWDDDLHRFRPMTRTERAHRTLRAQGRMTVPERRQQKDAMRPTYAARVHAATAQAQRPLSIAETLAAMTDDPTCATLSAPVALSRLRTLWGRHGYPTTTAMYHAICQAAGTRPFRVGEKRGDLHTTPTPE